jgi:hypothetical protein
LQDPPNEPSRRTRIVERDVRGDLVEVIERRGCPD